MTITILCAGALALPAGGDAAAALLPAGGALARRLARAQLLRHHRDDAPVPDELPHEAWLRERFGIAGSVAGCALPAADAALDGALLVRPVHLHVGLDHLRLAPPRLLDISADEARALAERANEMLADSGLIVHATQADAWALSAPPGAAAGAQLLAELAALHARSARMAEGRQIDVYLPTGTAARQWRRLSTEVQMAWFEHPVNQQRDASGHPPINSLWLEGSVGRAARQPFSRVVADDPVIIGLARRAGIACLPFSGPPPDIAGARVPAGLRADADAQGRPAAAHAPASPSSLIALDLWHAPGSDGDLPGWQQAWREFADWFERNAAALPTPLHLVLTGENSLAELRLSASDRWAFWRRRSLAGLIETDA